MVLPALAPFTRRVELLVVVLPRGTEAVLRLGRRARPGIRDRDASPREVAEAPWEGSPDLLAVPLVCEARPTNSLLDDPWTLIVGVPEGSILDGAVGDVEALANITAEARSPKHPVDDRARRRPAH